MDKESIDSIEIRASWRVRFSTAAAFTAVWFGEYLPEDQFAGSEKAAINSDMFFVVGTSAVVYPAAGLVHVAKQSGAFIVEVNIEETEITPFCDISFFGEAGKILPELVNEIKKI